ncbi:MAG: hypothetical protein AAGN82_25740 [Myxococcota bacterium]
MMLSLGVGCGPEEVTYKPQPAYSGQKPSLPAVPTLPNKAKKTDGAYNIYGAMHDLHSRVHHDDFDGKDTPFIGYVVATNYDTLCEDEFKPKPGERCVPKCAIHKTGKQDPADCRPPVPAFWIADEKGETDIAKQAIQVMGFASNFAQMFTYIEELDRDEEAKLQDEFLGHDLPNPLPSLGARVKVTGLYGFTATPTSQGTASNPRTGLITWRSMETLEKGPKRAVLPGMKVRNVDN